jgi:hypothetical protein
MHTRPRATPPNPDDCADRGARSNNARTTGSITSTPGDVLPSLRLVNRLPHLSYATVTKIEFVQSFYRDDDPSKVVQVSVRPSPTARLIHFVEPYDEFPSDKMVAQLMLVL